jgi:hypothetical protein
MIGLEGSGFTICLGVILLLTGIVMYYCKSKITQNEHKINSMFKLVNALHEEVNNLKTIQQQNISHLQTGGYMQSGEQMESDQPMQSGGESEWSQTTQMESNNVLESINEEKGSEPRENAPMPNSFLNHPYEELIPSQLSQELNESDDSQSETDNEDQEIKLAINNVESNTQDNPTIKVVDLGEIEELKVEEESDDDEEEEELEETDSSETGSEGESPDIDYTKMQVVALKKIVSERNLATNVSKLRKPELLSILQAQ